MYSYGSPHTAAQKQDDQHERTFSSYVRIQVVVLKTYLGRWTIGRSGERGSGISVLPARYDDDDDDDHNTKYFLRVKHKQPHLGFEHGSLCPVPKTINIRSHAFISHKSDCNSPHLQSLQWLPGKINIKSLDVGDLLLSTNNHLIISNE